MEYELNKWDIFTISTGFSGFLSINRNTTTLVFGAVESSCSTTSEAWYPIVIEGTILHGCEIYYGGQAFFVEEVGPRTPVAEMVHVLLGNLETK